MEQINHELDFIKSDLLKDVTEEEVSDLVRRVFGGETHFESIRKETNNNNTTFDIHCFIVDRSGTHTSYPRAFAFTGDRESDYERLEKGVGATHYKELVFTKYGFMEKNKVLENGQFFVFDLLSKQVDEGSLDSFKSVYLQAIGGKLRAQHLTEYNKQMMELHRLESVITQECDEGLRDINEFMGYFESAIDELVDQPDGKDSL